MAELIIALSGLLVMGVLASFLIWFFLSDIRSITAGAPFSPMSDARVSPLLDMARVSPKDIFFDLGCGDGRVIDGALRRGAAGAVGYDVGWWPLLLAKRRLQKWGERAQLYREDARTADVSTATVVYLYLFPKLVNELAAVLTRRLRPGVRVVVAAFPIDTTQHPAFELIETRTVGTISAYLYRRA